jgi:colanic acid biosynthesis glycosyl transferase WcaI
VTVATPNHVLIINQSGGPLFTDLLRELAARFPGSTLLSGGGEPTITGLRFVRGRPYDRSTRPRRLLSWLSFLISAVIAVARSPRTVPMLVVSNPPFLPWLAAFANSLTRRPFVVLVWDVYPDILIKLRIVRPHGFVATVWRAMDRWVYRRASRVVAISPQMAKLLRERSRDTRVELIPTWADTAVFRPIERSRNRLAVERGIDPADMVVMYSGNLGFTHDVEPLVRAAVSFVNVKGIRFFVIGHGGSESALRKLAIDLGATNVQFLPPVPVADLPLSLATADVSVVSLAPGFEGLSMPSKTYFAMASGSAILGLSHQDSDLAALINREQCGINVAPGDTVGLVSALQELRNRPALLAKFKTNSLHAAERLFSRTTNTAKFAALIEEVIAETGRPPSEPRSAQSR